MIGCRNPIHFQSSPSPLPLSPPPPRLPYPDTAVMMLNRTSKEIKDELTSLEQEILQVWQDALGRPVHPDDNFFEIGGHSILATQVTFQLRQVLKSVSAGGGLA